MLSCEGELVVPSPAGETETPGVDTPGVDSLPVFNFQVRQLPASSGSGLQDTPGVDTMPVEVYLKQLDFSAPTEHYTLIVSLPANFDGEVLYEQAAYRSQDWIELPYQSLINHTTTLAIVVRSSEHQRESESHTINVVCRDRLQNAKNASFTLIVPADTTPIPPADTTVVLEDNPLPQFNFLVRQLEDSLSASLTEQHPADTLPVEVYLRQVDFSAPEERYTLIVSFPSDLDGEILYNDTTYRSGDWIRFFYHELTDNTTTLDIVPRRSAATTDTSSVPQAARQYLVHMACHDRGSNTKTATLALKIPSK